VVSGDEGGTGSGSDGSHQQGEVAEETHSRRTSIAERISFTWTDRRLTIIGVVAAVVLGVLSLSSYPQLRLCEEATAVQVTVEVTREVTRAVTVIVEAATQAPNPTPSTGIPQPTVVSGGANAMVITEIMFVPVTRSQLAGDEVRNEYLEVYNSGTEPIDLADVWLSDGDTTIGQSDTIVPWDSRFRGYDFGPSIVTDTTIIQPGQYGLILSPGYIEDDLNDQPYDTTIADEYVVLTVEEQSDPGDLDVLGDRLGLEAHDTADRLDVVFLYVGTQGSVSEVVASYGAPRIPGGSSPTNISSQIPVGFPFRISAHGGVRLTGLDADDTRSNWEVLLWGNQTPCY